MKLFVLMSRPVLAECASDREKVGCDITGVRVEFIAAPLLNIPALEKAGWRVEFNDLDILEQQIGDVREADGSGFKFFRERTE